jgi:ubiquinone/menaquinone biosynthesis C-methylase UbiE
MQPEEREYYAKRAGEYDDWYLGRGLFEGVERAGWDEELRQVAALVAALTAQRVLDVACGTGFSDTAPARRGRWPRPERRDGRDCPPPLPRRAVSSSATR